jgi:GMP synthase (glutamine-hydrolysing)
MHKQTSHIAVIDPATGQPELDCFNHLSRMSALPLSYHLPALYGFESLYEVQESMAGLILLGSRASVNDVSSWRDTLCRFLESSWRLKLPTFAICYGHQLIAHMHGIKIEKLPCKLTEFRTINFTPNRLWGESRCGALAVAHEEFVTACPQDFEIVASSEQIAIDGMAHKDLPIWSFQPHPEATLSFLRDHSISYTDDPKGQLSLGHSLVKNFLTAISAPLPQR